MGVSLLIESTNSMIIYLDVSRFADHPTSNCRDICNSCSHICNYTSIGMSLAHLTALVLAG